MKYPIFFMNASQASGTWLAEQWLMGLSVRQSILIFAFTCQFWSSADLCLYEYLPTRIENSRGDIIESKGEENSLTIGGKTIPLTKAEFNFVRLLFLRATDESLSPEARSAPVHPYDLVVTSKTDYYVNAKIKKLIADINGKLKPDVLPVRNFKGEGYSWDVKGQTVEYTIGQSESGVRFDLKERVFIGPTGARSAQITFGALQALKKIVAAGSDGLDKDEISAGQKAILDHALKEVSADVMLLQTIRGKKRLGFIDQRKPLAEEMHSPEPKLSPFGFVVFENKVVKVTQQEMVVLEALIDRVFSKKPLSPNFNPIVKLISFKEFSRFVPVSRRELMDYIDQARADTRGGEANDLPLDLLIPELVRKLRNKGVPIGNAPRMGFYWSIGELQSSIWLGDENSNITLSVQHRLLRNTQTNETKELTQIQVYLLLAMQDGFSKSGIGKPLHPCMPEAIRDAILELTSIEVAERSSNGSGFAQISALRKILRDLGSKVSIESLRYDGILHYRFI